jgi:RHS repeat-associated protein
LIRKAFLRRYTPKFLAVAAVLAMTCMGVPPAQATWSGWEQGTGCVPSGTTINGSCETLSAACQSWAEYRGTWVTHIKPSTNAAGEMTGATCLIRHFLEAGSDFQDPTFPSCPAGYEVNGNLASGCQLVVPRRALGRCTDQCKKDSPAALGSPDGGPTVGNPISLATGNKFEAVTDYRSGGSRSLTFTRYYNSQSLVTGTLGPAWRHNYDRRLIFISGSRTDYHAADGKVFVFNKVGSDWVSDSDVVLQLSFADDEWQLTDGADQIETFDATGRLIRITERGGYQQALEYFGVNSSLSLIHDSHGQRLRLSYNADGMLESITDGAARKHIYLYRKIYDHEKQPATLLEAVVFPDDSPFDPDDNSRVEYLYEDEDFPVALTGIIDGAGERFATWSYDAEGRAVTSEHAGTSDLYTVVYNPDGSRSVTNPLGQQTVYHFTTINGLPRIAQIERLAGPNTAAATTDFTYDANGFLASSSDWEGNVTNYVYDSRGLLTGQTEAVGTSDERTVTTTWHNDFRVPTQIVAPRQTVDLTYDTDGLLASRQLTDTTSHVLPYATNGETRTWTYSYSAGGVAPGSPTPLPDVPLTLINPGAETGDMTGWTVTLGAFTTRTSGPNPSEGSYYFYGGEDVPESRMHQDVTILPGNIAEVDAGQRAVRIAWMHSTYQGRAHGTVIVRFLDGSDQLIGDEWEYLRSDAATWTARSIAVDIPPLTRKMRIELRAIRFDTIGNHSYFDDLSLGLEGRDSVRIPLSVQNGDAEVGDLTGWTSETGNFQVKTSDPRPAQGDNYFHPWDAAESRLSQIVPFATDQYAAIDEDLREFEITWRQYSLESADAGSLGVAFLDGAGVQLGATFWSPLKAPTWWEGQRLVEVVPPEARSARITLRSLRGNGTTNNAYFDYIFANLISTEVPQLPLPRQLVSIDGPRSDVTDTTTFAYDDLGQLETVTNALSQVSSITERDGNGLPLTLVDENGIETRLRYDARRRLVESRVLGAAGDAVTAYEYDAANLLMAVQLPNGSRLAYEYDAAHRLTAIANDLGERIEYTLDEMGNRTAEVLRSATGAIVRDQSGVFDELGRLLQSIGAGNQVTAFGYDTNSNQTSVTDPLSGVTAQAFDALDRLVQQTDPLSGITGYAYDAQDNLVSVTDPRGLVTTYTYNGFGEVIQLESPDTGTTVFTLDGAGNVVSQTDARGVVTDFTYDALNRPLTRSYPATPAQDVAYGYDDTALGNRGIGRLTTVTDRSGSTELLYDDYGNLVQESRTIDGVVYTTDYAYDLAGNLLQITHPDGRLVTYGRDALGRVATILTQPDAAAAPVVVASEIEYQPFGPVASLTFGNGVVLTYSYDQDYRLTAITAGDSTTDVQDLALAYDDAHNITAITDLLDTARDQSFQYDGLHRLTQASGLYGTIDYDYDAVGNRTERIIVDSLGTLTETYTYDTASNRLLSLSDGATTQSFTYSTSGQIVSDDRGAGTDLGFVYDESDRLIQLQAGGVPDTDYRHNAFGERVAKELVGTSDITHFHYGPEGQLIGESDELGDFQRSYIYLEGMPIAQIEPLGGGTTQADEALDNEDMGVLVEGSWVSATEAPGYAGADYLVHPGVDPMPAGGTVLDNASPGFATTGLWPASSDVAGFEGADYVSRSAEGPFAEPLEIDNLDPEVIIAGAWNLAERTLGGHTGPNYLWHAPTGLSPETIYLDNVGPEFSSTGFWGLSTWTGGGAPYAGDFLYAKPDADPADTVTVDNESPGFSTFGDWATSTWTGGGGRFYTNYRVISPTVASPDAVVVDNLDAGFSVSGAAWNSSTNTGNGRLVGSNIFWLSNTAPSNTATWTPTLPAAKDYRVYAWWTSASDRASDATYTVHHASGSTAVQVNQKTGRDQWNLLGTFSLAPGNNHRVELSNQANGVVMADAIQFFPVDGTPNTATWTPEIPQSQEYHVYAWWSQASDRAQNAPFTVHHAAGSDEIVVNQRTNGGQWNLLGTYPFAPGSGHRVEVTNSEVNGGVNADAVKFVPVNPDPSAPPPTATWTPEISVAREYDVFAMWSADSTRPPDATYVVHHSGGTSSVVVNQRSNGGQWNLLGTYTFAPESGHRIDLSQQPNGFVIADAIQMVPTDGAPNSVTWTLPAPDNEYYTLETRWIADANRATDAPYTIHHADGSDTVAMNQQVDLGVWKSLGSYLIPGDGSGSVVLTDQANGEVVADAVRLTADTSAVRSATWTYSAAVSGDYRIFARWPAAEGNATNAKYTVQHAGGSSTVSVSQAQRGGQWNELGVFGFSGGQNYAISLSDDANGTVVADALYIVKVEEATDAVTWAPVLPASGTYQVYAKWTSDETRATDARYSIVHEGGTAEVTRNQRVGGGLWHYLGAYAFDPLNTPMVTLAANDNGSVAADAVRFVGGPGGATDIAYLHNDHLGTPQAMTDANAQVLWWRDQTPFGQTVAEGGFSVSPLRFPGQYDDIESGLAYNYFRDYDPALGRYIQSDPIGLRGGLNTYGYVKGNPLKYRDPYGLQEAGVVTCLAGPNPICVGSVVVTGCKWIVIGGAMILLSSDVEEEDSKNPSNDIPSNVGPGPFAGESVPAGPGARPNKEQQEKINEIGDREGCHTCGAENPGTKSGNWIGDHQDPNKLNPEGKPQSYYPQCLGCSNEQGGRVRWLPKR